MKTILITGSTDGIGLATMKMLLPLGHRLIVHGRTEEKVQATLDELHGLNQSSELHGFTADLVDREAIRNLAEFIKTEFGELDVLINNAGVFSVPFKKSQNDLDIRFDVNTVAPYLLTKLLLPIMPKGSRVVNLSSAAQAPVNIYTLSTYKQLTDSEAYAQSKLAILMWGMELARIEEDKVIVSINPKSFLGSKMVKDAYGVAGHDLKIGADILTRAALSEEFSNASGKYYDNDREMFTNPHPFALQLQNRIDLINALEKLI